MSMRKADREAGARRARVVQALVMQGGIAVILLGLAWFSRADRQSALLYVATLVIPIGWGYVFWLAYQRDDAARREGRWSKELDATEKKRTFGMLGALFLAWFVLAFAIVVLV